MLICPSIKRIIDNLRESCILTFYNIIQFNNLSGANLSNIIFSRNSEVSLTSTYPVTLLGGGTPYSATVNVSVSGLVTSVDSANNRATISSNTWLSFANVAFVTANANSTTVNVTNFTNTYYYVDNNVLSSNTPLALMVFAGDTIQIGSNTYTVASVNGISNIITTTSNVYSTTANSLMSVNRTFAAGGTINNYENVIIYNTAGTIFFPEITTESGVSLTTEYGDYILLG